ncbi:hypothetical protein Tco_1209843 [Tanacetum coccineum]
MFRMMLGTYREIFELRLQDLLQMFNATIVVKKGHYARNYPKPKNDFLVADATQMEEIEELSANICLMARIQPANIDSNARPSYDSAYLSEVQKPSTGYVNPLFAKDNQEQKYPNQPKIINDTISDDQTDSNIIFDEPNVDVNSGSVEYDNNVQASYELEKLARNAYKEAEKQQINANKMSENEDKYHDTVLDLEARAKENDNMVLKIGRSLQGMFMLGSKPMSFYDPNVKHGLGYRGLKAASSFRRPSNRESPFKNSVLSNTKNSSEKVEVFVRTNKKTYVASKNVFSNKNIVTDVDVKNNLKVKDILCVSCAKNVFIPCHDKCLGNYKLNVHSKVRRALFTTPRKAKSTCEDTSPVVSKTRFFVTTTQSKSLDTTPVVSKTKMAAVATLSAKQKVSSAFKTILVIMRESSLSKYMKNKIKTSRMWKKWYELQLNVVWSPIKTTLTVVNSRKSVTTSVFVKKWVAKMTACPYVVSSCVAGTSIDPPWSNLELLLSADEDLRCD